MVLKIHAGTTVVVSVVVVDDLSTRMCSSTVILNIKTLTARLLKLNAKSTLWSTFHFFNVMTILLFKAQNRKFSA